MKKKWKERLKSLLILLLVASAVFLAYKSAVFHEFVTSSQFLNKLAESFGTEPPRGGSRQSGTMEVSAQPIWPVCVVLTNELGAHLGAAYDEQTVNALYDRCASLFAEALGSAGRPKPCQQDEWQAALGRAGIYLDYQTMLPIRALPRWLGVSAVTVNPDEATRFLVAEDENGAVSLYYAGATGYSRCGTASAVDSLRQITADILPNGAYFAFEGGAGCDTVEEDTLILPDFGGKNSLEYEQYASDAALREQLAAQLGMTVLGGAAYSERDGTQVYVGGNGTLRFWPDGRVGFNANGPGGMGLPAPADESELIDWSCALLTAIRSGFGGEERLSFESIQEESDGSLCVCYAYYADGVRVLSDGGSAAVLRFEGGQLLSLELSLIRYSKTGEEWVLLPALQAAAIAGGLEKGSGLSLIYTEGQDGTLVPAWTARP